MLLRQRLDALRKELEAAVASEDYEKAAALRDRVREMERTEGASDG